MSQKREDDMDQTEYGMMYRDDEFYGVKRTPKRESWTGRVLIPLLLAGVFLIAVATVLAS